MPTAAVKQSANVLGPLVLFVKVVFVHEIHCVQTEHQQRQGFLFKNVKNIKNVTIPEEGQ